MPMCRKFGRALLIACANLFDLLRRYPGWTDAMAQARAALSGWLRREMRFRARRSPMMLAAFLLLALPGSPALAQGSEAQTVWRLLDYMAVDYSAAVDRRQIINQAEYAEMVEFAGQVRARLARLPDRAGKDRLLEQATQLVSAVQSKEEVSVVSSMARRLGDDLLSVYPVPLAPASPPDVIRGAQLFAQHCASCHGANGNGHGPASAGLDPPPIDFTDRSRARDRSVFALYQVINQGLEGTAMPSFAHLPDGDRWALALHTGRFAYPASPEGERLWREDPQARQAVRDLQSLAVLTPSALARTLGEARATAVMGYVRGNPSAVGTANAGAGSLTLVRERLAESLAAYERGDHGEAGDLALSAYLDGFEPVEPLLAARDGGLLAQVETEMGRLRTLIAGNADIATIRSQHDAIGRLLDEAERRLAPESGSDLSSFIGAFTILLREGLEALLIVVAMISFLRKAERQEALGYVHGGWIAALGLGAVTWVIATYAISISGASRELTEGFGSLFAAAVLLSVGIWMHGKAQADSWQRYIKEKMSAALSKGSAWFLFGLTFIVVYREVFETILFYATLWSQGNRLAVASGAITASALLAVIAWAMLRYSKRLPIAKFFAYSSALIAVLAVVLAGKGTAALQEAGLIGFQPLAHVPRIEILGLYPTRETLIAQFLAVAIVVVGFWYNRATARQDR